MVRISAPPDSREARVYAELQKERLKHIRAAEQKKEIEQLVEQISTQDTDSRFATQISRLEKYGEFTLKLKEDTEKTKIGEMAELETDELLDQLNESNRNYTQMPSGKEMAADADQLLEMTRLVMAELRTFQQLKADKQLNSKKFAANLIHMAPVCQSHDPVKKGIQEPLNDLLCLKDNEKEFEGLEVPMRSIGHNGKITALQWASIGRNYTLVNFFYRLSFVRPLIPNRPMKPSEAKVKKVRVQARNQGKVTAVVLKQKDFTEEGDDNPSVMKELDYLLKTLKKLVKKSGTNRVNYYQFVLDPHDFGRTIENMFHTSIILRDGNVQMAKDKHGMPALMLVSEQERRRLQSAHNTHHQKTAQAVMVMTREIWKAFCDKMKLKRACIKPLEFRGKEKETAGVAQPQEDD